MKNYEGNQENLELLKELLSHIGGELVEAETYYDNFKVVLEGNTYEYNTLYGIDEALVHMYFVNINKLSSEMKEKYQKAIATIESNLFDMVELYRLAYDEEVSLVDMYKQVIVDEAWQMLKEELPGAEYYADFLEVTSRRIRKRRGNLIVASQSFKEFVQSEKGLEENSYEFMQAMSAIREVTELVVYKRKNRIQSK